MSIALVLSTMRVARRPSSLLGRAAERLEVGGVGINVNDVTELQAPFGSWKQSGFGRELGRAALKARLETKHVRIGLQTTVPSWPSGATVVCKSLS